MIFFTEKFHIHWRWQCHQWIFWYWSELTGEWISKFVFVSVLSLKSSKNLFKFSNNQSYLVFGWYRFIEGYLVLNCSFIKIKLLPLSIPYAQGNIHKFRRRVFMRYNPMFCHTRSLACNTFRWKCERCCIQVYTSLRKKREASTRATTQVIHSSV